MNPYSRKGKFFNKEFDNLYSYEDMKIINKSISEDRDGFYNTEIKGNEAIFFQYTPKKTQHKKDVIAAFRRSGKKTERQDAKQEIRKFL